MSGLAPPAALGAGGRLVLEPYPYNTVGTTSLARRREGGTRRLGVLVPLQEIAERNQLLGVRGNLIDKAGERHIAESAQKCVRGF